MRIVFDCRYTRIGRHDGISRYTAGLVGALGRLHPVTMLINDHRQLDLLPDLPWEIIPSPTSAGEPWVARVVNRLQPDVVFTPMQTMGGFGRKYRLVLTVHDLIYYRHPTPPRDLPAFVRGLWRLYHLAWWPQRMLLNRSDAVVTVSETTKALIAEHHLTKRPVHVVPNAADMPALAPGRAERTAPETKSLVYMGSFMPYKNVDTLVRAVALLPDYTLHLMSRVPDAEQRRLSELAPAARLVFHGGASDPDYAETLAAATALVSASHDEGFGIPLVEAMTLGTPVVVSDIPIFREIGGDAALFFEADAPEQAAARVRQLEQDGAWAAHSAASRAQAQRYTWEGSAERLLAVLTEVASRRR
ncbi:MULTISPECIES: glycosyltransferase family 1 protein [unclassified Leifsonia]|uniref:glycosyltransferase family 4 protein n=1 Tax=unclassified Leifsonia TaxID=2663824 RepID=UPI0008A7C1A9|nr:MULTISPECIES: glycosyltransferase family 1 protein [unclassified Leifsonia]SEH95473.1 Glycosyltransferase involved in cell wall bisynthesis [Leifsonia sp. CL154]SFL57089.1 Glycosyltransferase involved in cell wall bisynthesis [Leifsonia sp. CL147]